jgi:hypothetical protein
VSATDSTRQHTSAYVSIRHIPAPPRVHERVERYRQLAQLPRPRLLLPTRSIALPTRSCIRQHTSAYVSIRQHTSAIRNDVLRSPPAALRFPPPLPDLADAAAALEEGAADEEDEEEGFVESLGLVESCSTILLPRDTIVTVTCPASKLLCIRQHTSAYVGIRRHTSAYASIREHT